MEKGQPGMQTCHWQFGEWWTASWGRFCEAKVLKRRFMAFQYIWWIFDHDPHFLLLNSLPINKINGEIFFFVDHRRYFEQRSFLSYEKQSVTMKIIKVIQITDRLIFSSQTTALCLKHTKCNSLFTDNQSKIPNLLRFCSHSGASL